MMTGEMQCTGEISSTSEIILGILNSVSGLAAIIGNGLVMITFFKNQSLRQPCYYLVASLSAIDLFVGLAVNPLYIVLTNFVSWQYREQHLLQLESFLDCASSLIIMYTLCVMSIERYIAVLYPLRYYSVVTVKRCCIAIGVVWLFSFMLNAVYFAISNEDLPKMWIVSGVLTGLVPSPIISYCYGKILQAARQQSRRIAVAESSVSAVSRQEDSTVTDGAETTRTMEAKKSKKTAWTVGIVVLLAVSLSMPMSVTSILQIVTSDLCRFRHLNRAWMWSASLALTSSAIDPWIYAIRIRDFKASIKRTLGIN